MKKKSSTEVWVTIGLAVFFLIFLSPIIIALFGSFREMGDTSNYLTYSMHQAWRATKLHLVR